MQSEWLTKWNKLLTLANAKILSDKFGLSPQEIMDLPVDEYDTMMQFVIINDDVAKEKSKSKK